jgi:hypothetical protein
MAQSKTQELIDLQFFPVPTFENYFWVNKIGQVKGRSGKILKPVVIKGGYLRVRTGDRISKLKSKTVSLLVHRAVALTFLPKDEERNFVNHKNGDKSDNCVENLEWCTHLENIRHAVKSGLTSYSFGENNGNSVLTDELVLEIKKLYVPKTFGPTKIAKLLGVSKHAVKHICQNRTWKNKNGG